MRVIRFPKSVFTVHGSEPIGREPNAGSRNTARCARPGISPGAPAGMPAAGSAQITPWASIASATFTNDAVFAPTT